MELVTLDRFELGMFLGSGSDYEAYAATDLETGQLVVVKRPNPDYILRGLHRNIDVLSESLIDIYNSVGNTAPWVCPMVGYTDVKHHGSYFGDTHEMDYRVLVFERARGIPLVADIRDKFKGIPIGLGQNLYALHPQVDEAAGTPFLIQQQLLDVEEAFQAAGHLLLDLRPQNVYFDPASGCISVIDTGTVPTLGLASQGQASAGGQAQDIHDFYAEVFRYYLCPDPPPVDVKGYRDPYGMRAIPDFAQQVDEMTSSFAKGDDPMLAEAAVASLQKIRARTYTSTVDFRHDLQHCLQAAGRRDLVQEEQNPNLDVWQQARSLFLEPYWSRFIFDPSWGS